jgi:hypothetical protein
MEDGSAITSRMRIFALIQRKQSGVLWNPLVLSKALCFINLYWSLAECKQILILRKQNILKFSSYTVHMIINKLLIEFNTYRPKVSLSLTLREEHWLRVFENSVLRRIFGPRRMKWREIGGNCITRSFITCTPRQT